MKKAYIEKSLKRALSQAPTVDFEILANTPVFKMEQHDYITRQQKPQQTSNRFRRYSLASSLCIFALVCFSVWFLQYRTPDSSIYLDVNPSIEIVTNKQNHILSVMALNEDAHAVIDGLEYKKSDLNSTVDAILTALMNHGYLTDDKNVIMVSVENKSTEKADTLAVLLDEEIHNSASTQNVSLTVLRQVLTEDKEASALAEQYGISVGKMKLIQEITSSNATYSAEVLAHMSLKELLEVSKENAVDLTKTIQSDDDYSYESENNPSSSDTNNDNNDSSKSDTGNNSNNSPSSDDRIDSAAPETSDGSNGSATSDTNNNINDSLPQYNDMNDGGLSTPVPVPSNSSSTASDSGEDE